MSKLNRSFFARHTLEVAKDLIGKVIYFKDPLESLPPIKIMITETESYRGGGEDLASHAAKGITPRTKIMFGVAGFSYIYLIYGMYYCLNFVTEEENTPGAVLIRGGIDLNNNFLLNGPGKLCKYLKLNKSYNTIDITSCPYFYVEDHNFNLDYIQTPRIGITKSKDLLWRFIHNKI